MAISPIHTKYMFFFCYNILSLFLLIPVCIYHFYRSASRGRKAAFGERFGFIPAVHRLRKGDRPVIWLHAVSVGETIAARPLLKALRSHYPDHAIAFSCTTETGRSLAEGYAEQDLCFYFPFDFLPAVSRALDTIRPRLIIIMETEIWPNFTRQAALRGIPVLLANGRISDRSFPRYLRFSWFFRQALQYFAALCMQTETDRQRITAIGAALERTITAGNLKYDIPSRLIEPEERLALRRQYGVPEDCCVLVAGSTHPGEEEQIVPVYRALLKEGFSLFLVLVPRHPERGGEVEMQLRHDGFNSRRRSGCSDYQKPQNPGEVLLVDTIGELMKLYALADLIFVGGSLVPTGGHNLLEPASVGVPSLFGPHMTNFREITALVLQYGAGIQVDSPDGLHSACREMITCPDLRSVLGQNGLKLLRDSGGATRRHMEVVTSYL